MSAIEAMLLSPSHPGDPGEMVTTTVAFDRATYKRLRLLAVERDTNVRELIREAVADYLKRLHGRKRP
jgi:predicted transcriptional regulator